MASFNLSATGSTSGWPSSARCTFQEMEDRLWQDLSKAEFQSFQILESIYNAVDGQTLEAYHLLEKAFASPMYGHKSKNFFAATHIGNEFILQLGDKFLTEEILLSYIQKELWDSVRSSYLNAIVSSSHFSEQVIEAVFQSRLYGESKIILASTPDAMITPKVIIAWLGKALTGPYSQYDAMLLWNREHASQRIGKAHPEYQGLPKDWVLKVFCGR